MSDKIIEFMCKVFDSIAMDIINCRLVIATIKTFWVIFICIHIMCSPLIIIKYIMG